MSHASIWIISLLSIVAVIIRSFKLPEATWAIIGAVLLLHFGLILPADGLQGVLNGIDVYLKRNRCLPVFNRNDVAGRNGL